MSTDLNERAILGTLMMHPDKAAVAFSRVPVEHFDGPLGLVAEAIQGLRVSRKAIDPSTVTDEMRRRSTLGCVGPAYAHEIAQHFISVESLDYHLDAVAENRRLRKLTAIGVRLANVTEAPDANAHAIAHSVAESVQSVIDGIEASLDVTTETMGDFLAGEDEPYDWVIPGLLERGDRFVLTGSEGLGKSVLFRQLAVGAAAGVHPFTHQGITPHRVLYVDVENSRKQLRRALRGLSIAAKQSGGDPNDNLFIECRPDGLDLTRSEDEAWLLSRVVAIQPSILVCGPLYRLHAKNPNDEEPARKVAQVLDRCRAAASCALVLEAHAGHGLGGDGQRSVRPTGTSLWLRWPEFGYGIRPSQDFNPDTRVVEFVPWRGDRDERDWPTRLKRGGSWPWQVATDPNQSWTPYPTPTGRQHTA